MKNRSVIWSEDAVFDLDEIASYIMQDNSIAAFNVIDKIEETGNNLGKIAIGHHGRMDGTYEIGVPKLPYILTYILERNSTGRERIIIVRVIHTARNWTENKWPD